MENTLPRDPRSTTVRVSSTIRGVRVLSCPSPFDFEADSLPIYNLDKCCHVLPQFGLVTKYDSMQIPTDIAEIATQPYVYGRERVTTTGLVSEGLMRNLSRDT